jgi:hypothetical protein
MELHTKISIERVRIEGVALGLSTDQKGRFGKSERLRGKIR